MSHTNYNKLALYKTADGYYISLHLAVYVTLYTFSVTAELLFPARFYRADSNTEDVACEESKRGGTAAVPYKGPG